MSTRLFRSVVLFGAAMGAGTGVVSIVAGCDLYFSGPMPQPRPGAAPDHRCQLGHHRGRAVGIIDASTPNDVRVPRDAGAIDGGDTKPDGAPDHGIGSGA